MHLSHCSTWGFCLHSFFHLIISKSQPDSYWNSIPEHICLWVTLPHNPSPPISLIWLYKLCVCICVCEHACKHHGSAQPVWSSLNPCASMARSLALNSNILASIHGYTSVILNHTKRESSDFPAGFALCGPSLPSHPPSLSHWVAQKHIMARGRKCRWCNRGPWLAQ